VLIIPRVKFLGSIGSGNDIYGIKVLNHFFKLNTDTLKMHYISNQRKKTFKVVAEIKRHDLSDVKLFQKVLVTYYEISDNIENTTWLIWAPPKECNEKVAKMKNTAMSSCAVIGSYCRSRNMIIGYFWINRDEPILGFCNNQKQ